MNFTIEGPIRKSSALCMPILRDLPDWFGMEEALLKYEKDIEALPTFLARSDDEIIGFISLKQHYPTSAEVLVMGILPAHHRKGIGQALLQKSQAWAKAQGIKYLQVKTLGPSREDAGYANTRAFYLAMGFHPLEELTQIWDENNPCLIMVKKI